MTAWSSISRLNELYGVEMGKKDRGTIARFYRRVSRAW